MGPVNNMLTAYSIKVSDGAAYGSSVAPSSYLKLKGVAEGGPQRGADGLRYTGERCAGDL